MTESVRWCFSTFADCTQITRAVPVNLGFYRTADIRWPERPTEQTPYKYHKQSCLPKHEIQQATKPLYKRIYFCWGLELHQLRELLLEEEALASPPGGNEPPKLPWCCARVLMFLAITAASSSDNLRIVVITGSSLACSDGSEVRSAPTTQFLRYSRLMAAFRPEDKGHKRRGPP